MVINAESGISIVHNTITNGTISNLFTVSISFAKQSYQTPAGLQVQPRATPDAVYVDRTFCK